MSSIKARQGIFEMLEIMDRNQRRIVFKQHCINVKYKQNNNNPKRKRTKLI